MVKPMLERTAKFAEAVARGARRPQTLPTQVREMASGVVTCALYPFGFLDAGPGGRMRSRGGTDSSSTPVLLVHGYLANKSNWYFVERELRAVGFDRIHAMNYSPRHADVDRLAETCVLRAHEVMAATGAERIHLVGHSLGGLVIRKATQALGLVEAASVVTVASPHGGVDLARLTGVTRSRNAIAAQLRPGSTWLRSLWAGAHAMPDTRFVAYYSNLDLLVPGRRAMMLEPQLAATNILMKDHGHLSIMLAPALARSIAQELAAIDGIEGHGRPVSGLPVSTAAVVDAPVADRAVRAAH
jgi:pimeloyl-ACP methyl ester carboxylesterase